MPDTAVHVDVEGRQLRLSNLEKVLYPDAGFTKAEVIDYYTRVAPALLPHLRERALTLKRYPSGVDGEFFYEKNCPRHRPPWLDTVHVPYQGRKGAIDYCLVNDLAGLIWVANLASLELHTSLARAADVTCPSMVVFDLDPGPPADIVLCCDVALRLRRVFDELKLKAFAKTSGSKGLQLYVPLNQRGVTYDETKGFAYALAREMEKAHPGEVVSNMKKDLRAGKVFVDWSQNDEHKTTVCVYSLRARPRPTVSTPVTWDEVERCARRKDASLLVFDVAAVLARVEKDGDLFAPTASLKQRLG